MWIRNNPSGEKAYNWQGGKIDRECLICGNHFGVDKNVIKKGKGLFCSRKCNHVWKRTHHQLKSAVRCCGTCGKEFRTSPSRVKRGFGKFCSRNCSGKSISKRFSGAGSYRWRNGITTDQNFIRTHPLYFIWRGNVFERDRYTCQKCHTPGGKLHAHHIKRVSTILQEIREKYPLFRVSFIASGYRELWDIKNGITLCESCHKLEHKKK